MLVTVGGDEVGEVRGGGGTHAGDEVLVGGHREAGVGVTQPPDTILIGVRAATGPRLRHDGGIQTGSAVGLRPWSTVIAVPGTWPDGELDELVEDVLVDAYGDSEQLGAFECVFAEAGLPVAAVAVGMACTLRRGRVRR